MTNKRKWEKRNVSGEEAADVMLKYHQTCTQPGCLLYVSWIVTPKGERHIIVQERDGHTTRVGDVDVYETSRLDVLEDYYGFDRIE